MAHLDPFVHSQLPRPEAWPVLRYDEPDTQLHHQLNTTKTLFDRARAQGWQDRPLLRNPSLTLSYAQVQERVKTLAEQLIAQWQLPSGSRVLLRGSNSIGMAIAWLAVCRAGWIVVATMPLLRARELTDIANKAQIQHAICDQALAEELDKVIEQAATPLTYKVSFSAQGEFAIEDHAKRAPITYEPETDDIGLLAFTSGTTGVPKAACHSHRDMLAACFAWPKHCLKTTPNDIIIGSPPLAFTFGLGGLLLFPMAAGASVYFHDKPYTPEAMVDVIHQTGATICYTAPTFYRQMAPFIAAKGKHHLRISVSAGEALPPATRQLWKDSCGIEMTDGIGATEMFHIFVSSDGSDVPKGALGKVVPGYYARIVDDNGKELPRGQIGKLAVSGPTGCKYLADERQANYVKGGWNFPGDAFMQDEKGWFYYQARTDDMIISAGYNIGGPEVESCLLAHNAVAECGVVGAPDEERGMIVKAFIVLKQGNEGNELMAKQLQDWVKNQLAPYKYPRAIVFLSTLPRTETGKLQRFKLREIQ
jgi:2-aminobenzoate-CoA ligase